MEANVLEEILEVLEKDSRYSVEEIAIMTGKTREEVEQAIKDLIDGKISDEALSVINGW